MNKLQIMKSIKSNQNLLSNLLKPWNIEVSLLLYFSVVLGVLIKIVSQQLSHNEEMFFVVKEVDQSQ